MVPCINKPECKPPKPKIIDVGLCYFADREILSTAREDMDCDMDRMPLLSIPTQKRKRKTAAGTRVRRRLETDQVPVQTDDTDLGSAPTTSSRCSPRGPSTHHEAVKEFAASLDVTELRTIVTELLFRDQGAFQDYRLGYRPCDDPPRQPHPGNLPRWCRCGN